MTILGVGIPGAGRLTLFNIYIIPVALTLLYKYAPRKRFFANVYYYAFLFLSLLLINIGNKESSEYNFIFLWEKIDVF